MKTVEIKIYKFAELSPEAKETALENKKEYLEEHNDIPGWIVDDCALLEPKHDELVRIFGEDYDSLFERGFLIINNRKVFFDIYDNYLNISEAMEIDSPELFFKWLEVPEELGLKTLYTLKNRSIEFENDFVDEEFTNEENQILMNAQMKFRAHCDDILDRITSDYEGRMSDEGLIEEIESNDDWFTEDGEIHNIK